MVESQQRIKKKNVITFDEIKEKMQTIQRKMLKKEQSCMELVQTATRLQPQMHQLEQSVSTHSLVVAILSLSQ